MDLLILRIVALLLLIPAGLLVLYELGLALLSLRVKVGHGRRPGGTPRLALVMPAHNEADGIIEALEACTRLDYPPEAHELVVIADNCSDDTAGVVRGQGVRCLERHDPERRGKGYALRWAFDQLLGEPFEAFVVLDADCWLDSHALWRFAAELEAGHRVLQASYEVSNPDASPISYALAVGNAVENDLYYRPKSQLGWVVALRGTGMVLQREVLQSHPWGAYSIVEDLDYTMSLYGDGIDVQFLADVVVHSSFPETLEQLRVQRRRWAGGNAQMSRGPALRLLLEGARRGDVRRVDMGLTILSQSRPLLLVSLWASLGLAVLDQFFAADPSLALLIASSFLNLGLAGLLLWGIVSLGLSWHRMGLLARVPWVVGRLVAITLGSLFRSEDKEWQRTPRT